MKNNNESTNKIECNNGTRICALNPDRVEPRRAGGSAFDNIDWTCWREEGN